MIENLDKFYYVHSLVPPVSWLDTAEKLATIIAAGSIFFAFMDYLNRKRKDNAVAVMDQANFFRDKIISKGNKFLTHVRKTDPNYVFSKVALEDPTIKGTRENQLAQCQLQSNLIKSDYPVVWDFHTEILNMLEEFSLRVIYSKTENHEALNSVRHAFITAVEMNAVALLMQREIFSGNNLYSATLKLYKLWNKNIDRRPVEERAEEVFKSI